MKDEIKEILELLDYITDLQDQIDALVNVKDKLLEENKESEEAVKYWQNQWDLRQRAIDKAIEYIKQDNELSVDCYYKFKDLCEFDDLLEILGDKENE